MAIAKTYEDMRKRLHEHTLLTYPTLRPIQLRSLLMTTAYSNGDMILFFSERTGDMTNIGAIKFGRRWLMHGSSVEWTGNELKAFMKMSGLNFADFARF